ncbi:MAG TPA: hypothetical protein VNN80_14045, partial [Polyangiaceae bacterium]|nr:hypothetical protein [Polyangiaceae bacterium]
MNLRRRAAALMLLSAPGGCASRGTPSESGVAGHLDASQRVTGADSSGDRGGNPGACDDGAPEPNDTPARATALPAEGPLLSSTCTGDEAFFRFDSPVPRGNVFQVIVEALQAPDELGVVVASLETGERNWSQSSFEDGRQVIGVVSDGGAYSVRVQVVSASVDEP